MKRFLRAVSFLSFIAFCLVGSTEPGFSQSVDFGSYSSNSNRQRRLPKPNLKQKTQRIWRGQADYMQFETGTLNGQLLTLSATGQHLHVNLGSRLSLLEGTVKKRIPGQILLLDAFSFPERASVALATVTYRKGNRLKTTVFAVRTRQERLTLVKYNQSSMKLVRPVGDRMMGQRFDLSEVWQEGIFYVRTVQTDYREGEPVPLPHGARVMSLRELNSRHRVLIDASGDLVLSSGETEMSRVKGDFGLTPHRLKAAREQWRKQINAEPVRLAPEFIPSNGLVAVMENPSAIASTSVMGWFNLEKPSRIKLYSPQDGNLDLTETIGPFDQTLLDLEVSPANPYQLLWLRKTDEKKLVLEMVDFRDVSLRPRSPRPR